MFTEHTIVSWIVICNACDARITLGKVDFVDRFRNELALLVGHGDHGNVSAYFVCVALLRSHGWSHVDDETDYCPKCKNGAAHGASR